MSNPAITEALKAWATPDQSRYIDACIESGGNMREAARKLGVHHSTVQYSLKRCVQKATLSGYNPEHRMETPVADGFLVRRRSEYFSIDPTTGKPVLRGFWQIAGADHERQEEILREAFEAMADELPRLAPIPAPELDAKAEKLCNVFTITDFHMGMLAWHKEGGEDWDLKIAEDTLYRFFAQMIMGAPRAKVAVINQLGDFLHQDGMIAETPTSGNALDSDTRFPKIVQAAVRSLRRVVQMALETHDEVHIVMAEGNHDIVSSIWLRAMFSALYENEPRVTVNESELPYYAFQWGTTLLGFHHGHLAKNSSLPAIFSEQFRRLWGKTDRCHIHTGHRHHMDFKEYPGAKVFQHPTMTARDAFSARGGWLSERQGLCMTYHLDYGHVGTNVVTPEMLVEGVLPGKMT